MKDLLPELQRRFGAEAVEELRIHMDGCPPARMRYTGWATSACKGPRRPFPRPGCRGLQPPEGKLGTGAAIGIPLLRRIPGADITEVVCRLVDSWLRAGSERAGEYRFVDFLAERTDDQLREISSDSAGGRAGEVDEPSRHPLVRIPGMLLEATGGADVIEIEAKTSGGPGHTGRALSPLDRANPRSGRQGRQFHQPVRRRGRHSQPRRARRPAQQGQELTTSRPFREVRYERHSGQADRLR